MSSFLFDLRCAVRALRTQAFGGAVVATLALGIGLNTAMFSVANAILLQPLPYVDPAGLIALSETNPEQRTIAGLVSAPVFAAWQTQTRTLERVAAFRPWGFVLTGAGEPERVTGARASADLFPLLGIQPVLGRAFTAAEDTSGAARVALISEGLWRRRLGAATHAVGRPLLLNGETFTVVGIMPHDRTLIDADVWVPLALEPFALQQPGTRALTVIGRLKPGATAAQAQSEMQALAGGVSHRFPDAGSAWQIAVVSLTERLVGNARPTVLIVWGAVALVLLIACANTANLLLARGAARQQEIAVCLALGATRGRILQRLLSESVLLALLGGLAGIPLALGGLRFFVALAPAGLPRLGTIRIDVAVLVFTGAVSVVTGIIFGLVPALTSLRPHPGAALKETALSSIGGAARAAFRNAALACQVALAVVVLVAAGLLVRSFSRVLAVDTGFQPDHVLTMTVSLPGAKYGDAGRRAVFFEQLAARVEAVPGVVAAGLTSHLPLSGARLNMDVAVDGRPPLPDGQPFMADTASVSTDFFAVMNIPLRRGRAFTEHDADGSAPVVVINDEMARRLWPDMDPIGRRVIVGTASGADRRPREIVGVVSDVRASGLETAPGFQLYVPSAQNPWPTMSLVVRTSGEPASRAQEIRAAVMALDADQPVYNVRSLEQVTARAVALRRFQVFVLVLFAAVALTLATIGIYSAVVHTVRLRTREIGLRMALGAQRRDVVILVIRGGMAWAGAGIVAGGAVALAAAGLLRGMLYGIAPTDPLTFAGVAGFAAMVLIVGSGLAGRCAASIDPLVALRHE